MGSFERTAKAMQKLESVLQETGLTEFLPKLELAFYVLSKEAGTDINVLKPCALMQGHTRQLSCHDTQRHKLH